MANWRKSIFVSGILDEIHDIFSASFEEICELIFLNPQKKKNAGFVEKKIEEESHACEGIKRMGIEFFIVRGSSTFCKIWGKS